MTDRLIDAIFQKVIHDSGIWPPYVEPMFKQVVWWRYCFNCIHGFNPDQCYEGGPGDCPHCCHYVSIDRYLKNYQTELEELDKRYLIELYIRTYRDLINLYGMDPEEYMELCKWNDDVDHYRHIPEVE